jgi:hypothetical protein
VHGVGGDALGAVDGAGVAETGRGADVVGGESADKLAAVAPDGQVAVPPDVGDGPAVAVLNPVVADRRRRRSLVRVMITSPRLARLPSDSWTCRPGEAPPRR